MGKKSTHTSEDTHMLVCWPTHFILYTVLMPALSSSHVSHEIISSGLKSEQWNKLYTFDFLSFTWVIHCSLLKWWIGCFHDLNSVCINTAWVSCHYYISTTCECMCCRGACWPWDTRIVLPPFACSRHWHLTGPHYCFYSHDLVFTFQSAISGPQLREQTRTQAHADR